jgi:signal transduction histidine kinase
VTVVRNGPNSTTDDLISVPVMFALGWLVGWSLRERTERTEAAEERARLAELEREAAARVAVAEERGRIARELHDVVAHAVSVIVLQVGAVRHRLPEAATDDREALRNVEEAGRTALAEMRRLLAAMRDDEDAPELAPTPGLDDLDRLVRDVRAAGLEVQVEVRGDRVPLPRGLDLSAYRIVQEALTNSLKHSGADRAEVTVQYAPQELCLQVRDHGRSHDRATIGAASGGGGGGHGLVGIRERVKLFDGSLDAGPAPGGGFLVRARLPLRAGS